MFILESAVTNNWIKSKKKYSKRFRDLGKGQHLYYFWFISLVGYTLFQFFEYSNVILDNIKSPIFYLLHGVGWELLKGSNLKQYFFICPIQNCVCVAKNVGINYLLLCIILLLFYMLLKFCLDVIWLLLLYNSAATLY